MIRNIINIINVDLIIFFSIQLFTVILSTLKTIWTIDGSRLRASIINAIAYTFGAVITKLITKQSFEVIIIITMLSNLIGVYIAKIIIDKSKKERLWTISTVILDVDTENIENLLKTRSLQYTLIKAENNRMFLTVFSHSKGESILTKEILDKFNLNYIATETI